MDSAKLNPKMLTETDWSRIAAGARFRHLLAARKAFIVPAFVFFLVYYLLLPILVGYAPKLMSTKILGVVTLAYLYALSQFVVGGIIALLYLKASSRFDALIREIIASETLAHAKDGKRET